MKTLVKREYEERDYEFYFGSEPEFTIRGDTIAGVVDVFADAGNNGDTSLTCGAGSINLVTVTMANGQTAAPRTLVTSRIGAGVNGNSYLSRCQILTTAGIPLERHGIVKVTDS